MTILWHPKNFSFFIRQKLQVRLPSGHVAQRQQGTRLRVARRRRGKNIRNLEPFSFFFADVSLHGPARKKEKLSSFTYLPKRSDGKVKLSS